MKKMIMIIAGAGLLLSTSACGQAPWEDSLRDYENATVLDPGEIRLYNNVDLHPNIALICANGLGFWTTTREMDAAQRLPELDKKCASVEDRPMR